VYNTIMSDHPPYLFWPQRIGPFETELRSLLPKVNMATSKECVIQVVENHMSELPEYRNAQDAHLRYRAFLMVLLDLLRQGWEIECCQGRLYLWPPDWTKKVKGDAEIQAQKTAIRQSLQWEQLAQLKKRSVREFIKYMERERLFDGRIVSIRSLFAEGQQLAMELKAVLAIEDKAAQYQALYSIIQPYLQLITPESRCDHTGFRLNDIWRYLRYTWIIPYNSVPGRKMFYLVRDAKRPFHPVIGIAALGSSAVQITARDDAIGWTPKAMRARIFSDRLTDAEAHTIVQMLHNTLESALADIATDELATDEELQTPTEETIKRLQEVTERSRAQRIALLRQRQMLSPNRVESGQLLSEPQDSITEDGRWQLLTEQAQQVLFRAKRADTLHSLLMAKRALDSFPSPVESIKGLRLLWETPEGQFAIKTLIRENKKRKIGINMMDIIVCGGIPPYNHLLGGKLVAMLMTSPQVVHDYKQKYKNSASNIASKMKGEEVFREPQLVFLGTTSLFPSGNSQYNRIAIPVQKNEQKRIQYIKYGLTKGYGSVHFSEDTVQCLNELQEHTHKAKLINNRFGEGVNPKFRRIRAGLANIGLTAVDKFVKHRSQRIVYGIPLGEETYAFLRGETEDPKYYFNAASLEQIRAAHDYISGFWIKRWLLMRIHNQEVLSRVSSFSTEDALLSSKIWESKPHEQPKQQAMPLQVEYNE
jgi:hypothetical protein